MSYFLRLTPLLYCLTFVLAFSAIATNAPAQAPTGNIEGTVTDRTGSSVTPTRITLTDRTTDIHRELLQPTNGRFQFTALPTGDYALRIESTSFATFIEEPIHISVCASVRVD